MNDWPRVLWKFQSSVGKYSTVLVEKDEVRFSKSGVYARNFTRPLHVTVKGFHGILPYSSLRNGIVTAEYGASSCYNDLKKVSYVTSWSNAKL